MTFQETIKQDKPVLVVFIASWSGPCRIMAPALEELKKNAAPAADVIFTDVDENPEMVSAYALRGVPSMILFRKGGILWQHHGPLPVARLEELINAHK
ncbi:thioredoxin family protein [Sediminibacterium ginsengisoli]|uniref:Thioredoxin 1 n=1 Tax=Sediminibacterium ginsengisoli TaxID=413434 RepID=A0A1T4KU58_9BACT|nr:thioredoxin family protein [Sediminibacterium ginsengisoli]SJZ45974.1 thioredoxin 1 [Sediminibacterium ginsengisoli]